MLLVAALMGSALALEIGDDAPEIEVEWLRGHPQGVTTTIWVHATTWCPASRASLQWLDDLAADDDLEVLVVGEEPEAMLHAWGEAEGWEHVDLGRAPTFRETWLDDNVAMPHAVVVHDGVVVWRHRLAGGPDDELSAMLDWLGSGRVDDVIATAEAELDLELWAKTVEAAVELSDLADLITLLQAEPRGRADVRATALIAGARRILEDDNRTKKQVKTALQLTERAVDLGGYHDPQVLDVLALAWEKRGKAGNAAAVREAAEAIREQSAPEPWSGSLNDAFDPGAAPLVGPTSESWTAELRALADDMHSGTEVLTPEAADRKSGPLVLYGTPEDNPLTAAVLAHHDIVLRADGVSIGGVVLPREDPVLIAALPSPWVPEAPVVLYTSAKDERAHHLDRMFHGPTSVVVGAWVDDKPTAEVSVDLMRVDGRLLPAVGQAALTPPEAIADLEALHGQLLSDYAGVPDMEATLAAQGTSLDERVRELSMHLRTRASWPWLDVVQVLQDFLEPVQDSHFSLSGRGLTDSGMASVRGRHVNALRPWFSDVRLDAEGTGRVSRRKTITVDLPLVPEPDAVVPGEIYRFPSLDAKGRNIWLIGVFSADLPDAIELEEVSLPLHAPRSTLAEREEEPWAYDTEGRVPVLFVRTMVTSKLLDLIDTAPDAKEDARLVLDLRGNGGGSDQRALDWTGAFSGQDWRFAGAGDLRPGPEPYGSRWTSAARRSWTTDGEPYAGELFVLTDGGVASSGETFVQLAAQVPGAKLVGTSTSGCSRVGNVLGQPPLPHTRLTLRFGHTRFVWEEVRPVREGVGIFPDVWLDEEDPVDFLARLPAR